MMAKKKGMEEKLQSTTSHIDLRKEPDYDQYQTIREFYSGNYFDKKCNELSKHGWVPNGPVTLSGGDNNYYVQQWVLRVKKDKPVVNVNIVDFLNHLDIKIKNTVVHRHVEDDDYMDEQ
jgi:hypothetical protein